MTTANLSSMDVRVRDAVMRQLEWDPQVDASAIGVAASDGSVTLTGFIDTYAGKLAAERAAKRVRGVRAVANDIEVRLRLERTDADIASDVVHALRMHVNVPDSVQASVHDGHVTLTGRAQWLFQRGEAERAVRHIRGVRGVRNYIDISTTSAERDVRHRIVQTLHRIADVDASQISVSVSRDTVTLNGKVSTLFQRESAERAAAEAPGIVAVTNHLAVESPFHELDDY